MKLPHGSRCRDCWPTSFKGRVVEWNKKIIVIQLFLKRSIVTINLNILKDMFFAKKNNFLKWIHSHSSSAHQYSCCKKWNEEFSIKVNAAAQFHQRFMYSFYVRRSQKGNKYSQAVSLFFLTPLESTSIKAAHKTLVKLTPAPQKLSLSFIECFQVN